MKIVFDMGELVERGTAVSTFDYALYGRQIGGIEPLIIYNKTGEFNSSALKRFEQTFAPSQFCGRWKPARHANLFFPAGGPNARFRVWPSKCFCGASTRPTRLTASVAHSAIGQATKRRSRASLRSMRSPMSSATRRNRPTDDPTRSPGDASSWTLGRAIARAGPARTYWRSSGRLNHLCCAVNSRHVNPSWSTHQRSGDA